MKKKPKTCQWVEGIDNLKDFPAIYRCKNPVCWEVRRRGKLIGFACYGHGEKVKAKGYQIR